MSSGRIRVAVTGAGIVSPLGSGRQRSLEALRAGTLGVGPIRSIDASGLTCRIAAEVPEDVFDGQSPNHDRFTHLSLAAASEAVSEARLSAGDIAPERFGTVIGTALGGSTTFDDAYRRIYQDGAIRLPPVTIPAAMYNAATAAVAARFGARGPSFSVVSACASGAHAIGQGAMWIRSGMADVVIAGGADAPISYGVIRAWEALRILAPADDEPSKACRPFSGDRAGMVLGEGAAIVVLESFESARRRGVQPIGEIAGFGLSSDAGHVTDPSARGAAAAMQMAIDDAGVSRDEVGYVNAHGTGTVANDRMETAAIHQVFGPRARSLPVSSTKAMHGHAMGASGAIELVLALIATGSGFLPPTMNLRVSDPECDLDYVPNAPREASVKLFLASSFGFGGMNGVLAVRTAGAL